MSATRVPLVLLPGMACDSRVWDPAIVRELQDFAELHLVERLVGQSVGAMAERVLRDVGGPFAVAGFSQGGIVALELATRARTRVLGVCAIGCSGHAPTPEQRRAWEVLSQLAERAELDAIAATVTPALVPPCERGRLGPLILDMVRTVGADALRDQLAAQQSRRDRRADVARIAAPALFLVAADDAACPPSRVAELADLLPHATFAVLPEGGHVCTLTRPMAVTEHLRVWLGQLPPTVRSP